ncbi:hypothetical protein TL16_g05857 [Triparma laevis f. inornata]|uniref:Kinesin light chain n=1 Tax=Triparma laevis f. inornata TaxID=1714386 RepID=A0A9W7APV3_9STRA|nr:hypothetical protein TL16_g05857 [Triparma laevis f. inornata]
MSELVSGEGFNEYFQKQFNGNEEAYLRWKEVFDVLEIGNARDVGPDLPPEQQVLLITKSEDLVKLRALVKLCSKEFFDDPSLSLAVWRRILEVLVLAMPLVVEKKVRGKKKKQQKKNDPRKLGIFDACRALGKACNNVADFDDAIRYYKRAKEGYEEQLRRDSEKALEVTQGIIMITCSSLEEVFEKLRDLVKRIERALGEEHVVILDALNSLGVRLVDNGQIEEAITVYERSLAGQMKVLGEDHKDTLGTLNNLGIVYDDLNNYEKALEYHERALEGKEKTLRKNHPDTFSTLMNIAIAYNEGLKYYGKAEELYQRALKGYEAQFGKDHPETKKCANNFSIYLKEKGNRLAALTNVYLSLK